MGDNNNKINTNNMAILKVLNSYFSEKIIIHAFLAGVALWVIAYGIFITEGFEKTTLGVEFLIILVPLFLIDVLKTSLETFFRKKFYAGKEELYKLTVIIPTYNGSKVIAATLADLLIKFKPCQIIVSANGCTDNTIEVINQFKGVKIINTKEPIGKVGAINTALMHVHTKYTLVIDDDVLVGNATFPTNPLGQKYSGIAFRVLPKITNWVTSIQSHEYRKSMDIGKVFHNDTATVQNISGAIGLFETKELRRQIEIHTGEFCGEDLQRTLLIHLKEQNKGVVIVDSLVETEVPDSIGVLFKQRVYGWNPGMYINLSNYIKLLFAKKTPWVLRYDALYNAVMVTLVDPLRLVALPILIYYPKIAAIIYLIYVLLEFIPYIALKQKDPLWIVLIYPLYGLFGFITRVTAFAVFMYRRLTNFFAGHKNPDDYRHANVVHRFNSVFASQVITLMFIFVSMAVVNFQVTTFLSTHLEVTKSFIVDKIKTSPDIMEMENIKENQDPRFLLLVSN